MARFLAVSGCNSRPSLCSAHDDDACYLNALNAVLNEHLNVI